MFKVSLLGIVLMANSVCAMDQENRLPSRRVAGQRGGKRTECNTERRAHLTCLAALQGPFKDASGCIQEFQVLIDCQSKKKR